jgi:predicted anti-sigma-YlaC factor YlaD
MVTARFLDCDRIREAISAQLDGELSELDAVRLRTHLERCDSCREFEASARFATDALRAAPLEPVTRPVALPTRRRIAISGRIPAAAAAAVLMVAVGGVFESLHGGAAIRGSRASEVDYNNPADMQALAQQQTQRNYEQLLVLRAQFQANRVVRHPGFQNP